MPLNQEYVKTKFWERIRNDPWILHQMRYAKGTKELRLDQAEEAEIARHIVKRRMINERLDDKNWYINIYFCSSRRISNASFLESVIQVDVMVPTIYSNVADEIISQVVAICTSPDFSIYGDVPTVDAEPGDLSTPSGFYGAGVRFLIYLSKETTIKKL